MKKSNFIIYILIFFISGLYSCSKGDIKQDEVSQENIVAEPSTYTIPLGSGDPDGSETVDLNLPPLNFPSDPEDWQDRPSEHIPIEFATPEYLKETRLLDISKLKTGSFYHQIGKKDFSIAFFNEHRQGVNLQKLKANTPAPKGWKSEWNIFPFVEKDCSDVLFSSIENGYFIIVLSKPCIEFGFEMTPNALGKNVSYFVSYGTFQYDGASGSLEPLTTYNPGGARIFALRSQKPFTEVEIYCYDLWEDQIGDNPGGSAITNIRYALANP
jgi:hypothetical protein